ncbi:hypothetical protein FQN57_004888 [Myotisia sp. PD_48]|nr:hypothetical protein FQN57_004888 [Myotisia sp. PD_48]
MSEDRKGSVRRARERAQAGLPVEVSHGHMDPGYHGLDSGHTPLGAGRKPPPVPNAFRPVDQESKGRSLTSPQWSPPDHDDMKGGGKISPEDMTRNRAPQRPPRPHEVSPLYDDSKERDYAPDMPYQIQEQALPRAQDQNSDTYDQNSLSVDYSNQSNRRQPGLVLPPSSRRAPPSFYPSGSHVSPIPEEFPENIPGHVGSFASSRVIPSSWGSAPPESFHLVSGDDSPDEDTGRKSPGLDDEVGLVRQASIGKRAKPALRTISKGEASIGNEEVGVVRQASLGKRAKPSLRTINRPQPGSETSSSNSSNEKLPNQPEADNGNTLASKHEVGLAVSNPTSRVTRPQYRNPTAPSQPSRLRSFSESSSADSFDSEFEKDPLPIMYPDNEGYTAEMKELGISSGRGIADSRPAMKLPPRLNIDAVKNAEARGSLTSLPDLIRRATKLASNLDRGRTASRLGILDMLNANDETRRHRNSGSLSDILASFPPPGIATPTGSNPPWPDFRGRAHPDVVFPPAPAENTRRSRSSCCGMPKWTFILLCVMLVALIAAAITIPVVLIVLPRQRGAGPQPSNAVGGSGICESTNPCMNGGISIGGPDSCSCVCVDGFSGARCDVGGDGSCVIQDIHTSPQTIENATLGSALPRLLEAAEPEFRIPLNASKILGLFNSENISCTSANALVTFNGSNRKRNLLPVSLPKRGDTPLNEDIDIPYLASQYLHKHHGHGRNVVARDGNHEDTNNPTPTGTEIKGNAPSPDPSNNKSTPPPIPSDVADFARISVLFILEHTQKFRSASSAHDSIQDALRSPEENNPVSRYGSLELTYNDQKYLFELDALSIILPDGNVIGGGGK